MIIEKFVCQHKSDIQCWNNYGLLIYNIDYKGEHGICLIYIYGVIFKDYIIIKIQPRENLFYLKYILFHTSASLFQPVHLYFEARNSQNVFKRLCRLCVKDCLKFGRGALRCHLGSNTTKRSNFYQNEMSRPWLLWS